jgi:patatin-like phospholipase/acyl hydrolase
MNDDEASVLRLPKARLTTAETLAPLRVLSLTGGGYRGLFTAQVLVSLCKAASRKGAVNTSIDIFAGTSIGGLMSCALAVGIIPHRVLDAIDANGPRIFKAKKLRTLRRVVFGTLYDKDNLAKAVDQCLGANKRVKLKDVQQGLIVPAIHWVEGRVEVFMSGYFGKASASEATLREVCLATSAAPTYFDAAQVDGSPMLDGGLAANNPDMLALAEILRRFPKVLPRVEMLSIGTAGATKVRPPKAATRTGLGWAPDMPTFMIDVQEHTAAVQAARLLGKRYLRVNHTSGSSGAFTEMDVANEDTRDALLNAGVDVAAKAYRTHRAFIDRFLSTDRKRAGTRRTQAKATP